MAIYAFVLVIPGLFAYLLIRRFYDGPLGEYIPSRPNDEVGYWRQIATFVEAGFRGGYYGYSERPAALPGVHFGPHGPLFIVIYGLIGKVVGWHAYTGPLINAALLGLATAAYLAIVRPGPLRALLIAGLIATPFAVAVGLSSTTPESLNQAIAIALAGPMSLLIMRPRSFSRGGVVALTLALVLAALLRPSWAYLVPLPAIFYVRTALRWKVLTAPALMALSIVSLGAMFSLAAAPVPAVGIRNQGGLAESIVALPGYLLEIAQRNVEVIWSYVADVPDNFAASLSVFLLIIFAVVSAIALIVNGIRRRNEGLQADAFHVWNLGVFLALLVFYYFEQAMSFSRVAVPPLLLSVLVAAAIRQRLGLLTVVVLLQSVAWVWQADTFVDVRRPAFSYDRAAMAVYQGQLGNLKADPNLDEWCNTLLSAALPPAFVALPPRLGLTYLAPPEGISGRPYQGRLPTDALGMAQAYFAPTGWLRQPVKSRYVLLDGRSALLEAYLRLQFVQDTSFGSLFLNLDAGCGDQPVPPKMRCPCGMFPGDATPEMKAVGISSPLEVGQSFYARQAGFITAVRFYKDPLNQGPHEAHLWDLDGRLLVSVPFENESEAGWQTAVLPQPLEIGAHQPLVVSYSAPQGRVSRDNTRRIWPPEYRTVLHPLDTSLQTPKAGQFPRSTGRTDAFWVDVTFVPVDGP